MKRLLHVVIIGLLFSNAAISQKEWTLPECVDYALKNNISVRQADIDARISALLAKQAEVARFPSLNFGVNAGYSFGLSNNPTTGVLENNNFFTAGTGLQSQVTLFNFFSLKRTVEANRLSAQADREQVAKIENDIALSVATSYLQVLLSKEQSNIARLQAELTQAQLENTRKQVDAGKLPEINAAELEAQLARDSSAYITAKTNWDLSVLQLKALLTLDAGAPFAVATPPVETIPIEPLAELQPEAVYALALANLPQQKVNDLLIRAAKKQVEASHGRMLPSLTASGSIGTNYAGIAFPQYTIGPKTSTGATVIVSGTEYDVVAPSRIITGEAITPFGRQFRNNFGQNIGVNLSVPIFNGRSARTNWERGKLLINSAEITKQDADLKLKQDVYTAYTNALAAIQKFEANKKTVETAARAYDFAQKRYDVGLLSTFELITSQNNLQKARLDLLYSQYDYVFKMKLLEFYKGQGIKL